MTTDFYDWISFYCFSYAKGNYFLSQITNISIFLICDGKIVLFLIQFCKKKESRIQLNAASAFLWVGNGDRTHDPQDHNLIL